MIENETTSTVAATSIMMKIPDIVDVIRPDMASEEKETIETTMRPESITVGEIDETTLRTILAMTATTTNEVTDLAPDDRAILSS